MKKQMIAAVLALCVLVGGSVTVFAAKTPVSSAKSSQENRTASNRKLRLAFLNPEKFAAKKAEWEAMSAEERETAKAAAKERAETIKAEWEAKSTEEIEAAKAEMKATIEEKLAEWKAKSPEERKEILKNSGILQKLDSGKFSEEERAAFKEKLEALTPEQLAKIKEHRQEAKAKWNSLSSSEQAAFKAKREEAKEKRQEAKGKWDSLSSSEQAAFKAKREEARAKWDSLSSSEQTAFKTKREEARAKWGALSSSERAEFRAKLQDAKAKWEAMTPDERETAKENFRNNREAENA